MPFRHNAMTDMSGSMYTFVSELTFDNLGQWESQRHEVFQGPGFEEWFREFQLIVQTGHQEFYAFEGDHTGWSRPGVVIVREVLPRAQVANPPGGGAAAALRRPADRRRRGPEPAHPHRPAAAICSRP